MQKAWDGCSACHVMGNSWIFQDNAAALGRALSHRKLSHQSLRRAFTAVTYRHSG